MIISNPFILESHGIPLLLLALLQHPIVAAPGILHLPVLVLIDHESLRLALLDQLILRLLICDLEYPGVVLLQLLK